MLTDLMSLLNPQSRRLFKFNTFAPVSEEDLLLEHFSGSEGLSQLYQMDLALLSHRLFRLWRRVASWSRAPERNREHSIGDQVSALNVWFMERLRKL